jgi:hypothetical protein
MSLNKDKIKRRITKAIDKLPTTVTIQRAVKNEFGEMSENALDITTINGLYHVGTTGLSIAKIEAGIITQAKKEYLMVVLDTEGMLIQKGDLFDIGDTKYIIQDLGDNHAIYLDMLIEKV